MSTELKLVHSTPSFKNIPALETVSILTPYDAFILGMRLGLLTYKFQLAIARKCLRST